MIAQETFLRKDAFSSRKSALKFTGNNPPPPQADAVESPSETDLRKLAGLISEHTPYDGRFELHVPRVSAVR